MGQKVFTKRTVLAYQRAMKKGTRKSNQLKLVMLGAEGAGKTCTVDSLLNKKFKKSQESTVGASINCCQTSQIFVSKWKEVEIADQIDDLPKLHKTNVKRLMTEMSPEVDSKSDLSSNEADILDQQVAAHVQEVVDVEEVSDGDVRIVILDLGGQEIYYEIHFLFLAPEDIVLMTFDASKGLDQPVIARQKLDRFRNKIATRKMQTNLEMLETLFQSVYSRCGRESCKGEGYISNRIPTIIMMATHSKNLTPKQKYDVQQQFYKYFSNKPFFDHLPKEFDEDAFFFIDNEFRDPEVFAKVKKIVQLAGEGIIEQLCPVSYLQFETELLQLSKDNLTISLQKAQDISIAAGFEEGQLKEALLYYCYRGVLLYYPDEAALQDVVFINPQEVSDLVSSVISTHNCRPSSAALRSSCDRYDTHGLLEERLLDDLLKRCNRLQQKEIILALLKKFDLAVEVPVNTKFSEEDAYDPPKTGRVFVVPSMLVYNERKIYQKKKNDIVVLFHYPDKFLPENVFNHVLVRTVIWCKEKDHNIHHIYRGVGHFKFKSGNQNFKLQECQATSSIKCYITIYSGLEGINEQDQLIMLKERQDLRFHLEDCIDQIYRAYIPSARCPIPYIECPLSHEEGCMPHIRLADIGLSKVVRCYKNDDEVVPQQAYMMLLTADIEPNTKVPTMKSVYKDYYPELIKVLPMDDPIFIAKLFAKDFLPGNTKEAIHAKGMRTEKATYFLDNMITTAFKDDRRNPMFSELLNLIMNTDHLALTSLAKEIKGKI